jgi:hypothetical protein
MILRNYEKILLRVVKTRGLLPFVDRPTDAVAVFPFAVPVGGGVNECMDVECECRLGAWNSGNRGNQSGSTKGSVGSF